MLLDTISLKYTKLYAIKYKYDLNLLIICINIYFVKLERICSNH
jgi:hypothetical protein